MLLKSVNVPPVSAKIFEAIGVDENQSKPTNSLDTRLIHPSGDLFFYTVNPTCASYPTIFPGCDHLHHRATSMRGANRVTRILDHRPRHLQKRCNMGFKMARSQAKNPLNS